MRSTDPALSVPAQHHKMHPDALAVANDTWSPGTVIQRRGYVVLALVSKRMHVDPQTDAEGADTIASALILDPVLTRTTVTLFNKQAVRFYEGTGMTDLAVRRG